MIRVGVLGCAHYSHARAYASVVQRLDDCDLVAVADFSAAVAQALAAELGVPPLEPEALVAGDGLDGVIVCSSNERHLDAVRLAAGAGLHVFCEKPLATTIEDGRAAITACEQAGVQLQVALVSRFDPLLVDVRDRVRRGDIGDVRVICGQSPGQVPPRKAVNGRPDETVQWFVDPARSGGGAVMDHSVHVVDAIRFVTGLEVESVAMEMGSLLDEELAVEDCASMLLTLEGGVAAYVDPSWVNPKGTDWILRVVGSDGIVSMDDVKQCLPVIRRDRTVSLAAYGADMDERAVRHFVDVVRTGELTDPAASGEDGLRAVEVVIAAYESAASGQPVALAPLRG